jgi:low temperature requirement protein LtrA
VSALETLELPDSRHVRRREPGEEQPTTSLELFFDLVYVFAVTQLSHYLLEHLTWRGATQTLFLLLVVWWAWIYTTWMTNWFDPDSPAVRLVLVGVMLASLLMAIGVPGAFGGRALLFAGSYVALQVLRNGFTVLATRRHPETSRSLARLLAWSLASAPLWLAGGIAGGGTLTVCWIAALALDYVAPLAGYWLPGRGRLHVPSLPVEAAHFAERFQLFVIIVLGESIVVTGLAASDLDLTTATLVAIAVALCSSAALWWLYFDYVAPRAQQRLDDAHDTGRLGRDAYTYLHIPMIAGIIAAAVGDELMIAHPGERLSGPELATVCGGPALYLLGHVAFRLRMTGTLSRKRLGGAVALVAVGVLGTVLPALATGALALAVLVAVIGLEVRAGRRRSAPAAA